MNLVCVCVLWKYHHLSPTSWNISKPSSNEENNSYIEIYWYPLISYTYIYIYIDIQVSICRCPFHQLLTLNDSKKKKKVKISPEPTIGDPYLLHPPELQDFDLSKVLNLGGQEWSRIRAKHENPSVLEPVFSGGGLLRCFIWFMWILYIYIYIYLCVGYIYFPRLSDKWTLYGMIPILAKVWQDPLYWYRFQG